MAVTLGEIVDAIEDTLDAATTLVRSQTYDELTEALTEIDMPLLQVYPESGLPESGGETERSSFGSSTVTPVRRKHYIIHADYYAAQRKYISEDMSRLVDGIDAMENILETENAEPFFGLSGIKAFTWSWSRVTFVYGDEQTPCVGARFIIEVWVY